MKCPNCNEEMIHGGKTSYVCAHCGTTIGYDTTKATTDPREKVEIEIQLNKRTTYQRFLVTSEYGWGFGSTIKEAKKNCRQQTPSKYSRVPTFTAKLVTEATTCDSSGGISYFPDYPPIELGEV